jgi:hypothetical protein
MTSTLQDMKHKICTAFGDSTDSDGGEAWTMPLPPQGIYQGNGVGPMAWLIISSNLLDIMRQLGFGTFFKAAISGDTLRIAALYSHTWMTQISHNPQRLRSLRVRSLRKYTRRAKHMGRPRQSEWRSTVQ